MKPDSNSILAKLSNAAIWMARLFFSLTIILLPFRFRFLLVKRPALPIYKDLTDFLLFGSDITVLIMLGFWGLSLLLSRRSVRLGPRFMWIPMAGLILTCLITSFNGLDVGLSLYHTLRIAVLALFYLFIVNEVHSRSLVLVPVVVQMVVQSGVALGQFFLQHSIGLRLLGEHDLDPSVRGVSIVSTGVTRVLRSYGLTEHPNILGGCLAFGLLLLLAVYLHGKPGARPGIALLMMLGLPALFVTFSRSAWLTFSIGTLVLLGSVALARDWKKLRAVPVLAVAGVLVVAPLAMNYSAYVGARFNVGGSFAKNPYELRSIGERLLLDRAGLHIFFDRPFFGVGLGASANAVRKYFPHFRGSFVPPHLVPLAVAMETGIVGLFFYTCLMLFPWVALIRYKVNLRNMPELLVISVLLMGITLISLLDIYPWLLPPGRLWQWMIWGLWVVACESNGYTSATAGMPD